MEVMNNGDGEIRVCENCGEGIYLEYEEIIVLCPKCEKTISYFEGGD